MKFDNQQLLANYLRMGYASDGSWRIYKLRPDFTPADKVQVEDDITVSVVLPRESLANLNPEYPNQSVKLVANCENMLFQRPDDAVHRGFDKDAEADIASSNVFLSNFEPLTVKDVQRVIDNVVEFDKFTAPMKHLLGDFLHDPGPGFVVSSAHSRIVEDGPSKNPRYLQKRPDLTHPREAYLAEMGTRLAREIPSDQAAYFPVDALLPGRRNNPPDLKLGLPPLAVYNPIHYQELPELFMDFICSLTGKSPSTTGFGTEGALTKGPFNSMLPIIDVNNALVAAILTGYDGFTTAAGHIGPNYRVDHDNSMLVPELWCRMRVGERNAAYLIRNGYLEKLTDFEFEGRMIRASRLGYRITASFVDHFMGRIFEMPAAVFPEEMLRPEMQDLSVFVQGVDAIVEAQRAVAMNYFEDGGIHSACPPVKALLHMMAYGDYQGLREGDAEFRALFTRESLVASDWYRDRLAAKCNFDRRVWQRHYDALETFLASATGTVRAAWESRLIETRTRLSQVNDDRYLKELAGTIGSDPSVFQLS